MGGNVKKNLIYFLLLLFSISLLAGCGRNSTPRGRFDLVTMEINGADGFVLFEQFGVNLENAYIEFLNDNQYRLFMPLAGATTGTFTVNNIILRLTDDSGEVTLATIRNNRITLTTDENGYEWVRVYERSRRGR